MTEGADPAARRRRGRRFATIFFASLLAVLLAVGGGAYWYMARLSAALDHMKTESSMMPTSRSGVDDATEDAPEEPKTRAGRKQPMAFVLIGADQYVGSSRSDSLMIAYLSGDRKNIYLISFPRDMWVTIPEHGKGKINAAYAYGGSALTVLTLQELMGVKMAHVAEVDFNEFVELTSVVGGVTVNNRVASSTGGYSWPQGSITIEGQEALAYVRQRKELPRGDLDRAERQRAVVAAIMHKLLSARTMDPKNYGKTLDAVAGTVTVDDGLTNAEVNKIARSLRVRGASSLHSIEAPIKGFGTSPGGQSIDIVDEPKLKTLSEAMKNDTLDEWLDTNPQ